MIITDYFKSEKDITWDFAKQCGVNYGVIRLPESKEFDLTNKQHWKNIYDNFISFGIRPIIIEPMPASVHEHIKTGDKYRDESIEKVIKMFSIMHELEIDTICFNWMAHIGWTRTSYDIPERGGASVTGFNMDDFNISHKKITSEELWENYEYFIKAIMPYAKKYNIKLALHPDDPPISKLGNVERIMINSENINRAVNTVKSDCLGITMCQATYLMMGENLYDIIPKFKDKIFFIHFRNATGNKYNFKETFHDNGDICMSEIIRLYKRCGIDVPIRVDHVPTLKNESTELHGYAALGRLFAIGYLKGLVENA